LAAPSSAIRCLRIVQFLPFYVAKYFKQNPRDFYITVKLFKPEGNEFELVHKSVHEMHGEGPVRESDKLECIAAARGLVVFHEKTGAGGVQDLPP